VPIAVVGGAIANKPLNGGEAWVRLSWVLGLRRLGYDVYFFERLDPRRCVDAAGRPAALGDSTNLAQLIRTAREFGLDQNVGLISESGRGLYGLGPEALRELTADADVVFDLSGNLGGSATAGAPARGPRVFVDLDPGFTQSWHDDAALDFSVGGYDSYVTVGLNVGARDCPIPSGGLEWIGTLPPVPLDEWSGAAAPAASVTGAYRFTTVSRWRTAHGSIALHGRALGLKHHALRSMIDLPRRVPDAAFELALDIDAADECDRAALVANGWRVVPARSATATPASFRAYVQGSCAEFSVAQPAYVQTRCGWFSDRTAAYLAAGRPALVQDTGLGPSLARDGGLLTFASLAEAVTCIHRLSADPGGHAEAAGAFAQAHLDSDRVLGRLLERLGVGG
jgi:hypothetical protein